MANNFVNSDRQPISSEAFDYLKRIKEFGLSILMTSQGIAFFQSGDDQGIPDNAIDSAGIHGENWRRAIVVHFSGSEYWFNPGNAPDGCEWILAM